MVVDIVDIGTGRRGLWSYFLIRKSDKNTGVAGVFFNYLQNQNKQL